MRADQPLVLFDLDHTLLEGDSDQLWCEFLMEQGLLAREPFASRNQDMARQYKAGTVDVQAFCEFYVGTLNALSAAQWQPWRELFFEQSVRPRLARGGCEQVQAHRSAGHCVVMTTATNRFITELTAAHLGIEHLIATEPQMLEGRFTGKTHGVLNMREGKVERLHAWLARWGLQLADLHSTAYSDSLNDLPLLESVTAPICTQPDAALERIARERAWPVLRWF
jgi:HAD superfamily hydrolase (TIGR01490 family)